MAYNANQTNFSDAVKTQYDMNLLMRALPRLIHGRWGQKAVLNKYGSHEWRRYGSLSAVVSALTEGTTPSEQSAPSLTLVTATPAWYGAWLGLTDELNFTSIDPTIMWMSGVLGEQAGLSIDTLRRNDITDGATKLYSGDQTVRTALDAPAHDISYRDILLALATLYAANAVEVQNGRYILILHPDSVATLFLDSTFVNLFTESGGPGDNNPMRSGFIGTFMGCEIYQSSNAREYANGGVGSTDVYSGLFIGKEAYGMVGIGQFSPKEVDNPGPESRNMTGRGGTSASPVSLIVKQLGSAGADDPLDQRATVAWKAAEDTVILNSAFLVDLEHTTVRSDS